MPILGKFTSMLMCSTMLGGPLGTVVADSPLDEGDPIGAESLLLNEIGFAIDATTYDTSLAPYVGAPCGGTVAIKFGDASDSPADAYGNVALDMSNLTQSGTSPKMVLFNSSPYVRWTPHNLITRSQSFDHTDYNQNNTTIGADDTTAPDGTTTADKVTNSSTTTINIKYDAAPWTAVDGVVYTISIYVKKGTADYFFLGISDYTADAIGSWFNLTNFTAGTSYEPGTGTFVSASITSVGSGWYRCAVTGYFTSDASEDVQIMFPDADNSSTGTNGATGWIWGLQINRGYTPTPYLATTTVARIGIPQEYDTAASKFGILVEPAGTNSIIRSEQFDNAAWTKNGTSISADTTTSPDGSTASDTLTANAGSAVHSCYGTAASISGTHTISVYVKQGTSQYVGIVSADGGANTNWFSSSFDLQSVSVTDTDVGATGTFVSSSIVSVGGGWYRISATGNNAGTTANISIDFAGGTGTPARSGFGDFSWNAAGTETLIIWGAQVESGSVATSYIPTLGSTVTRAADALTVATSTFPYSATASTLYSDFKFLDAVSNNFSMITHLDDGDSTDAIRDYKNNGDGAMKFDEVTASAGQGTMTSSSNITQNTRAQISHAVAANNAAALLDAGTLQTDGTVTMPAAATTLRIGRDDANSFPAMIRMYRFVYVPRRVTDGDLPTWRYNF